MKKLPVKSNICKCYNKNTGSKASGSPAQRGGEECGVVETYISNNNCDDDFIDFLFFCVDRLNKGEPVHQVYSEYLDQAGHIARETI